MRPASDPRFCGDDRLGVDDGGEEQERPGQGQMANLMEELRVKKAKTRLEMKFRWFNANAETPMATEWLEKLRAEA